MATIVKVLEQTLELESTDDGGRAMVARIDGAPGDALFARLQSWDEALAHAEFRKLLGQRVRVTIEIMPPERPMP